MNDKINAAINFFPEFETLYSIIANEIVDLTDEQLDYTSDNWEWVVVAGCIANVLASPILAT